MKKRIHHKSWNAKLHRRDLPMAYARKNYKAWVNSDIDTIEYQDVISRIIHKLSLED